MAVSISKLDGFRGLADTITGRMLSSNGNA
jgi:hypothetical protein